MIKVGVIGSTGYAGAELIRLLLQHQEAKIIWYGSKTYEGKEYSNIYKNMFHFVEATCLDEELEELSQQVDVIFTATPGGYSATGLNEKILKNTKVIDLSGDYRFSDTKVYEDWYKIKHYNQEINEQAIYGLCEINRKKIKEATLIANPGCYPTCTLLSLYPLIKEKIIDTASLVIDAKSGTSGAGRSATTGNLFCEVNESIKAYGVTTHKHIPEIEEQLSNFAGEKVTISFVPHLVPMNRGILITAYGNLAKEISQEEIDTLYQKYYQKESFIRVRKSGDFPETKWVKGSNFVDVSTMIDQRNKRIIVMGAMDNLVKGAAGQAIQNMNLMFGIKETTGLMQVPMFP